MSCGHWHGGGVTGPSANASGAASNAAAAAPRVIRTTPDITLPRASLFVTRSNPISRHLVENDPRFTNQRPGIALTPAQMAQLTSDIVWLVAGNHLTLQVGTSTSIETHFSQERNSNLKSSGGIGFNITAANRARLIKKISENWN